jgi:Uncharacterised nucleotidyltransferase
MAPEQELMRLLVATRTARAAAISRVCALAATADGERLEQLARAQSLLPLVAARLEDAAPALVPDVLRERAAAVTRETRHWGVAVEVMTERVAAALEGAGIPAIALKGPIMARALFGDPGLRVTSDIDLLVSPADFARAVQVLRGQGYVTEEIVDWQDGLPLFETTLTATEAWAPSIDLHWRLHWSDHGFSADALARSVPPDGRTPRLLAPLDLLAALLMIYARDGFWGMRGAADLAAWWDRYGDAMPSGGLDPTLAAHPALAPSIVAAATVAERLVGVPAARTVPGRVVERPASARAIRLAHWNGSLPPSRREAARLLSDVLVSPPGSRLGAVARRAWPPSPVVAGAYDRWIGRGVPLGLLRVYYAARIAKRLLPGHVALLWRSRGGRELCPIDA